MRSRRARKPGPSLRLDRGGEPDDRSWHLATGGKWRVFLCAFGRRRHQIARRGKTSAKVSNRDGGVSLGCNNEAYCAADRPHRPRCVFDEMTDYASGRRVSWLSVHPFDPLGAPRTRLERIRKVLCFPGNLVAAELHDAHGIGRLTVVCQDVFSDPKITAATDSPHSETLFTRLLRACDLYVASAADSLA